MKTLIMTALLGVATLHPAAIESGRYATIVERAAQCAGVPDNVAQGIAAKFSDREGGAVFTEAWPIPTYTKVSVYLKGAGCESEPTSVDPVPLVNDRGGIPGARLEDLSTAQEGAIVSYLAFELQPEAPQVRTFYFAQRLYYHHPPNV